jgi:hypothetical protein
MLAWVGRQRDMGSICCRVDIPASRWPRGVRVGDEHAEKLVIPVGELLHHLDYGCQVDAQPDPVGLRREPCPEHSTSPQNATAASASSARPRRGS